MFITGARTLFVPLFSFFLFLCSPLFSVARASSYPSGVFRYVQTVIAASWCWPPWVYPYAHATLRAIDNYLLKLALLCFCRGGGARAISSRTQTDRRSAGERCMLLRSPPDSKHTPPAIDPPYFCGAFSHSAITCLIWTRHMWYNMYNESQGTRP